MKRLTAFLLGIFLAPLALAEGKDSLWELTFRMEMADMPPEMKGMKIPGFGDPTKQTVCLAEGKKYESEKQKDCKIIDQKQSGRIFRMTMQCKEGTMKLEREEISKDHWRAKMEMTGSGREEQMTMFEEGKRIGRCDAEKEGNMSRETQKMLGDVKEQTAEMAARLGKECEAAASGWPSSPAAFLQYDHGAKARKDALAKAKGSKEAIRMVDVSSPEVPACARAKADYCAKSKAALGETGSRPGYLDVMKRGKPGAVEAAMTYCGTALAAVTAKHCKSAMGDADYGFIAAVCPAERKLLAKQHCAGRSYTAIEAKYRAICGGGDGGDSGTADSSGGVVDSVKNVKDAGSEAVEQGVKKLKGLFGF